MYCPDLYRVEKYNPAISKSGWAIQYERYRSFITFETPRRIKCIEEIMLYNTGDSVSNIIYDLGNFKNLLDIFDFDDRKLEFHGFSDPASSSEFLIKIEFPPERPFNKGEYKTVSLQYFLEIKSFSGHFGLFSIPLNLTPDSFIYFVRPKEYLTVFHFFQCDRETREISYVESSDRIKIEDKGSTVLVTGKNITENSDLIISINHELHEEQRTWFDLGGAVGWLSAVILLMELIKVTNFFHIVPSNFLTYIPSIVPLAVSGMTFLIVVKGWIFTKDMDWILNDLNKTRGYFFTYDKIYIALIAVIMAELIITIIICMHNAIM